MSSWQALARELDAWHAHAARATLWWRDDDASSDTPALRRLVQIARAHAVPVALAVIPARLDPGLTRMLAQEAMISVLQHGYAHSNHAGAGARSAELGADRPLAGLLDELAGGRRVLQESFGTRFAPVLVPPWNRIHPEVVAALPGAGFEGLSTFGPRASASPARGLVQCNSHVDVIAWRSGRAFIGQDRALERLTGHLAARRAGALDASEPTGLLTHHLDLGEDAWSFTDELLARTSAHPAVEWLPAQALFGAAGARTQGHLRPISMNRV